MDANDHTKEENLPKKVDNRLICKPRQRSPIRQNSPRSPGKESTSNSEESRDESSCCELVVKDEDQDSPNRKNIYAGGDLDLDLDLRATKTYIVDLIDRVLSKKFAMSPGQPKVFHLISNDLMSHRSSTKYLAVFLKMSLIWLKMIKEYL